MNNHDENRKGLKPGAEISVTGVAGRFTVHRIIGKEVTCYGGPNQRAGWRTFTVDRVKTVHYRKPERRRPAKLQTKPVEARFPNPTDDIAKGVAPARRSHK